MSARPVRRMVGAHGETSGGRRRATTVLAWTVAGALIVLAARALAYALSPAPDAGALLQQAGGPALPIVALVSIALALAASSAILWLAALGVEERRLLEAADPPGRRAPARLPPRPRVSTLAPRFSALAPRVGPLGPRAGALGPRAAALFAATAVAFALLESSIHARAGLGWHGLECLLGPVHRDALPILAALSLVVAALSIALEHVLAWMRRTLALMRATTPRRRTRQSRPERGASAHPSVAVRVPGARGPPFAVA